MLLQIWKGGSRKMFLPATPFVEHFYGSRGYILIGETDP